MTSRSDAPDPSAGVPHRQVRAVFSETTVRVYQAYSDAIADAALAAQTFVAPFKRARMTWIKPSFAWMAHRSGWARSPQQERVLGIDITRAGLESALAQSCPSSFDPSVHESLEQWRAELHGSAVRVQWDPERTMALERLPHRTIQIGISGPAVDAYVDQWIVRIEDVTPLMRRMEQAVADRDWAQVQALAPRELPLPLPIEIARRARCSA